jgi:NAD(P)-dependent dehydrogenase (short-subunit alcohol dehydrogenase family)
MDVIITGASRGIGRALALELAREGLRLFLVGRDTGLLASLSVEVAGRGAHATVCQADLADVDRVRALGDQLADLVAPGATFVHNAGLWPTRRELVSSGLERAFVVNHLHGLLLQRPLLEHSQLARVMVVSAGLITKGSFDPERTPTGKDFSRFRTYCTTKLCFAVAQRDVARANPHVDFVVLHPGIVNSPRPGST